MKYGILVEGLLFLYCCCCWIRDRPKELNALLVSVGKRLYHGRRNHQAASRLEYGALFFPNLPKEQQSRYYGSMKLGTMLLLSMIGGGIFLISEAWGEGEVHPGTQLERPEYGEKQQVEYQLRAVLDQEEYIRKVVVEVPGQEPTAQQKEELLDEAQWYIVQTVSKLDFHKTDIHLPETRGDVRYEYVSLTPEFLRDDGTVLWKEVTQEETAHMQVLLTIGEEVRELILEIPLCPEAATLEESVQQMLETLQSGGYLSDQVLRLPTEGEDGVRYEWREPKSYHRIAMAVLWIVMIPCIVLCIREQEAKRRLRTYRESIRKRYPDMLNKMMILMGAGMSLVKAWEKVVEDYQFQKKRYHVNEPLYEEMIIAGNQLQKGYSMGDVMQLFARRTGIKEIQQFCNVLQMGWRRGDAHVLMHLKELHDRSWDLRKKLARKLSEEADTKLLFPLMLMLMVVFIIILTPAVMTMQIG